MAKTLTALSFAVALMIGLPAALAQQGNQGNQGGTTTGAQTQGQTQGQGDGAQQQRMALTQDKLRKSLQQAGFKNIRVVDAAYLVHAQSQDGDTVVMYINPPAMGGTTASTGQSGSGTNSQNSQ